MKNNQKGSTTVEAALIFPIIFFVIILVFYMSIVMYQNTVGASVAMQSANRIAALWKYLGVDYPALLVDETPVDALLIASDFEEKDPYRFIFDTSKGKRISNAENYAYSLADNEQFSYYSTNVPNNISVAKERGLLTSYIKVSYTKKYINPLGRIAEKLGVASEEVHTMTAKSALSSQTEFIRNVDLIVEIVDTIRKK